LKAPRLAVLLCCFAAGAAVAQAPAAAPKAAPSSPSDEPTPSEGATDSVTASGPLRLRGFDLEVSITNSSGVFFGAEGYTNTLSLAFDPSFAIGRRFFEGQWLAPLSVSAHVPVEIDLVGSDPRFRGRGFRSAALIDTPEQAPIARAQVPPSGQVSGTLQDPILLGDTWLGLSHGKLFTIPKAKITFGAGLRAVLPTSNASLNAGLITAASVGVFAEREFGAFTVGYSVRPTKYFFTRTSPPIKALGTPVIVNGREEETWVPPSTGSFNPDWGVIHGLNASVDLPASLSLSASYLLLHVAPLRPNTCAVEGTPGANTCLDGPKVGTLNPNAMHHDHWFTFELDWKPKYVTLALGVSTYRPVMQTTSQPRLGEEGCATAASCEAATPKAVSQPFLSFDRNNYTTLYLSITASAEQLAQALSE
jgi:hypothetical protein